MTVAVVITILASLLWAITNHIDKFLIDGIDESGSSIKTLLVFSTLIAGMVLSPIWLIASNFSVSIGTISLICVLLASVVYILATLFYFKALEKNDASIIVVMFQMIPVFSYILALIFFKENLTVKQIVGSIIIIISAVLISFNFEEKNNKSKWLALVLMTISSLFYSTYFFLFDIAIRNGEYNSCAFWYQIGFLIIGLILMCIKSFRTTFIKAIKTNGKKYFSLNLTNEAINLIANLMVNFANVTIPLALASVLTGFQGAFAFILGAIGIKLLPKYFKEDLRKRVVFQKIGCIVLSIIGLIVMFG
ncbi:MAG: DMT family transporter [Clostridia bacterium]|nr:DMT family transporter [Clostridia bacterium]